MRCPRCDLSPADPVLSCGGCGFRLADLASNLSDAPQRTGAVVDAAAVLSKEGHARIAGRLQAFARASNHDVVVVTVPSTDPVRPAEYAFGLFNHWKVGGERRDGLMLLVAIAEQRITCELGPALAPALPDEASSALLATHAAPHLDRGDFDRGLFHGLDMLARVFEHAEGLR